MLLRTLFICVYIGAVSSLQFSQKSYSCVDGTCQLNARGVAGIAHGICLTTCGTGNLWPYPSGSVSISSSFVGFDGSDIRFAGTPVDLSAQMENNFRSTIGYLGKSAGKPTRSLTVSYDIKDTTVNVPSMSNDESYDLKVSTSDAGQVAVSITGQTIFGVRHGLETLSQLISYDYFSDSLVIPSDASIADKPTFSYRGVMVDVSRNFISMDKLKETVRAMGYNKMNVLHLHISDTASFPLEIRSQPNVTSFGAYDSQHYYTAAEVAEFVQFAHSYGVMILPEVDMPARVSAGWQWGADAGLGEFTLCADPDGTHGDQFLKDSLEPPSGQLNVVNENVYPVLNDIYKEVVSLFKSSYFHLGGDEVIVGSDEAWAACYNSTALAQPVLEYLNNLGLSRDDAQNFYALWDNFTMRATGMIQDIYSAQVKAERGHGESAQGLNKIHVWGGAGFDTSGVTYNMMLQPNLTSILPPSLFTIQVWDTTDDSVTKTLIHKGYDVVLSNTDYVYLDCGNAGFTNAGGYWCQPYHEWYRIYEYIRDITAKWELSDAELTHVAGSETLIWTEMVDDQNLSQKLWPRSAALAEALWSSKYLPESAAARAPASAKRTKDGQVERSWFEAAGRMLQWRQLLVSRGVAAEALQPRWCSQRDPYACYVDAGVPQ